MVSEGKITKGLCSAEMLRKEFRIMGRSYIPSKEAIEKLLALKGILPKSGHGWKQYFYNKQNMVNCVNQNIDWLRNFDIQKEKGQEISRQNSIDPSQVKPRTEFTPRKHGETNASLELLRNDESVGKTLVITEEQYNRLFEDVFINGKDNKKKKAFLTYSKRNADQERIRNKGNINSFDMLNTYKMDNDSNADTFEYPLKGGLTSYNITSIRGDEIMHYFKRHFDKLKTTIDLTDEQGRETYELVMADKEFSGFTDQFALKVGTVINYAIENFKNDNGIEINGISIFPVPSSSNFNVEMAKLMAKSSKLGLPTQVINKDMFKKDLSDVRKDTEFINKNKSYYDSSLYDSGGTLTHMDNVNQTLSKLQSFQKVKGLIDQYNQCVTKMLTNGYYFRDKLKPETIKRTIMREYMQMVEIYNQIQDALQYTNMQGGTSKMNAKGIADVKKYTKGPSVDKRTEWIWKEIIKPEVWGKNIPKIPVRLLNDSDFQIKNLTNDVRMAMRGYFKPQDDVVQDELNKIKGTVFVVFDDNISGGATLSDLCLQAKELGIEYIVPITFGQMATKYNQSQTKIVTKPTKSGKFEQY